MKPPPAWEGAGEPLPRKKNPVLTWILGVGCLLCCCLFSVGGGLFVPAFLKFRSTAAERECMTRLRLQGRSFLMYAADHDEQFPPSSQWMTYLDPLAGDPRPFPFSRPRPFRAFQCPALPRDKFGYAMLDRMSGAKMAKISSPATRLLVYDSALTYFNAHESKPTSPPHARHAGAVNVDFADGHAATFKAGDDSWKAH